MDRPFRFANMLDTDDILLVIGGEEVEDTVLSGYVVDEQAFARRRWMFVCIDQASLLPSVFAASTTTSRSRRGSFSLRYSSSHISLLQRRTRGMIQLWPSSPLRTAARFVL